VRVAVTKAKLDGAPAGSLTQPAAVATRFSARAPGDDLAAGRFSGSATRPVPGAR